MTISKMSLKINLNWKQILKWGTIAIFGIFILVFFIRVAVFEDSYYREKEGSERAEAVAVQEEPLEEEAPTEEQVTEYTVAADRPRYLSISKLGVVNARIIAVGVKSNGELGTPNNIFDVGWYEASGKPGQGGVMVIDGHNGGPHVHGVFKDLPNLVEGDIIKIERGDGKIFEYKVVENKTVALSEADAYMKTAFKSPVSGKESVTLISCTGEWSQAQGTYLSRQFTRAILVD
ncbi:class F sortase [Candidatus Saccharibacteria bacterium]|nr:class F sortase [Candidatus Saccharibacteria bacterium]